MVADLSRFAGTAAWQRRLTSIGPSRTGVAGDSVNRPYLKRRKIDNRRTGGSARRGAGSKGDVLDQPFRVPLRNGDLQRDRLARVIQVRGEKTVRAKKIGIERDIVLDFNRLRRDAELHKTLDEVVSL